GTRAREELLRHALAHQRHQRLAGAITGLDVTPAHDWDLQRLEVLWVHHGDVEQRQLALVRLGTRRERDGRLPLAPARQLRRDPASSTTASATSATVSAARVR